MNSDGPLQNTAVKHASVGRGLWKREGSLSKNKPMKNNVKICQSTLCNLKPHVLEDVPGKKLEIICSASTA